MTDEALSPMQIEVLELFFSLPESRAFVLSGGAGLIALGLSDRRSEDLDLFTTESSVTAAGEALEAEAARLGWTIERIRDTTTFRRVVFTSDEDEAVLIDLGQDSGPLSAATITSVGPVYPQLELAGRKVLALFGRAELRDFIDVATLVPQLGSARILAMASAVDAGFDREILLEMIASLSRYDNGDIRAYGADPKQLREFFDGWAVELRSPEAPT